VDVGVIAPFMHCYLMAYLVHKVSAGIMLRIFTALVMRVREALFYLVVFINFCMFFTGYG